MIRDFSLRLLCWVSAILVVGVFGLLLADVVRSGLPVLSWEFLVRPPLDAGRAGGISTVIVSTTLIIGICLVVSLPLATATAVFLSEYSRGASRAAAVVGVSLETLAGVPSIVFGLFGGAFFSKGLGLGFSILSGGLTLACMVLPFAVRLTESSLRAVPDSYRQAGAALGISRRSLLRRVLLPAAIPGITAGVVLSLGRALSETAALLFTAGYVTRMPESLFDSGRALSVHIFDLATNIPGGAARAAGSTLVLLVILLLINSLALAVSRNWRRRLLER